MKNDFIDHEAAKTAYEFYMRSPFVMLLHLFLVAKTISGTGNVLAGAFYFLYFLFYGLRWVTWTLSMTSKKANTKVKKIDWNRYNAVVSAREKEIVKKYGTLDYQREHYGNYKKWREKHHK